MLHAHLVRPAALSTIRRLEEDMAMQEHGVRTLRAARDSGRARLGRLALAAILGAGSLAAMSAASPGDLLAAPASGAGSDKAPAAEASAPPELSVYAAASLRDALGELKPGLEKASGATLVFNFAGSNDLARQILAADKADLFISADEGWMDKVAKEGLTDKETRRALLSNRLVVIAPQESPLKIASAEDLAKPALARIAMADPESVPAGKYAKAWLEKKGLWSDAFKARILSTADVRAALAAVASGNVDAGVVYKTDAAISPKVKVLYAVPEGETPKISYPIAVMAHSAHAKAARTAAQYLEGAEARVVFERFGFLTMGAAVKQ